MDFYAPGETSNREVVTHRRCSLRWVGVPAGVGQNPGSRGRSSRRRGPRSTVRTPERSHFGCERQPVVRTRIGSEPQEGTVAQAVAHAPFEGEFVETAVTARNRVLAPRGARLRRGRRVRRRPRRPARWTPRAAVPAALVGAAGRDAMGAESVPERGVSPRRDGVGVDSDDPSTNAPRRSWSRSTSSRHGHATTTEWVQDVSFASRAPRHDGAARLRRVIVTVYR